MPAFNDACCYYPEFRILTVIMNFELSIPEKTSLFLLGYEKKSIDNFSGGDGQFSDGQRSIWRSLCGPARKVTPVK
jgi:hypothetical protein